MIKAVTIYCSSSNQLDQKYYDAAKTLGKILADEKITCIYGGGSTGLMGAIADSVLENDGYVKGIIPGFMQEVEWDHKGIQELIVTEDMHERKKKLVENTDAIITLPGGSGTLEELYDVLTLKRLGQFFKPIILFNQEGFYDPLIEMMDKIIDEKFMHKKHRNVITIVKRVEEIIPAIRATDDWDKEAIHFATM